jgi:hypothetical protein
MPLSSSSYATNFVCNPPRPVSDNGGKEIFYVMVMLTMGDQPNRFVDTLKEDRSQAPEHKDPLGGWI